MDAACICNSSCLRGVLAAAAPLWAGSWLRLSHTGDTVLCMCLFGAQSRLMMLAM